MLHALPGRAIARIEQGRAGAERGQQRGDARDLRRRALRGIFGNGPGVADAHDHGAPPAAREEAAHRGAEVGRADGGGRRRQRACVPRVEPVEQLPAVDHYRHVQQRRDVVGVARPHAPDPRVAVLVRPACRDELRHHVRGQRHGRAARDVADEAGDVGALHVLRGGRRGGGEDEAHGVRLGDVRRVPSSRPTARSLPSRRRRRPWPPASGRCTSSARRRAAATTARGSAPRPAA